jgi:putative membrane protein
MEMHWYDWHGYGWGWGMMLLMALFWLLLIAGIVLIVKWAYDRSAQGRPLLSCGPDLALRVLRERYARGEIAAEQYREARQELEDTEEQPRR